MDYAVTVEEYTLQKSANLVMNVDGCIGALFLVRGIHSPNVSVRVGMRSVHVHGTHMHGTYVCAGWVRGTQVPDAHVTSLCRLHAGRALLFIFLFCRCECSRRVSYMIQDLLSSSGAFTKKEADDIVEVGVEVRLA